MNSVKAVKVGEARRLAHRSRAGVFVCIVLMTTLAVSAQTGDLSPQENPAYADLQSKPYEYHGLGRELPEPKSVETIHIGLYVPSRGPRAADGLSLRRGAEIAIDVANSQGGLNITPFELIVRTDDFTWGSAREVVRLAYEDHVWAVVGAIGGASTHVAQQIITKAQLPLIGTASSDASLTQINIPWMFRLMPDDDAIAHLLATHLIGEKNFETIVSIASTEYDSRLRAEAFEKLITRFGVSPALSLRFSPATTDFASQLSLIERSGADAVVIWGEPQEGVALLQGLAEFEVFAGPGLDRAGFFRRAGSRAEGLTVVSLCDLDRNDPFLQTFNRTFTTSFGSEPNAIAAFAYDGVSLVVDAIRRAGLNRAKIRDALAKTSGFQGVTGNIFFDGSGANTVLPVLKIVREGQLHSVEDRQRNLVEMPQGEN